LPWLLSFGEAALEPMITAGEYFSFAFSMVIASRWRCPFTSFYELSIELSYPVYRRRARRRA
jgi:Sec-independent protein secretion pathway component TatC